LNSPSGFGVIVRNFKSHDLGTTKTGGVEDSHESGITRIAGASFATGLEKRSQLSA